MEYGQIVIEDLLFGDWLKIVGGGYCILLWKGSIVVYLNELCYGLCLMCISVDVFGFDKLSCDIVFGKLVCIFQILLWICLLIGLDGVLVFVIDLEDGVMVIGINFISMVQMFYLGLV